MAAPAKRFDYNEHLDSGKHVLFFGGSNTEVFSDWLSGYVAPGPIGWHTVEDCTFDWNKGEAHPITALLPWSDFMIPFLDGYLDRVRQ